MADYADPIPALTDIIDVFEGGVTDGITLDAVLCAAFVDGLSEARDAFKALAALAQEAGLLERLTLTAPGPRTPVERRLLAATAAPLDPDGRVIAFPVAFGPALVSSTGGSAA